MILSALSSSGTFRRTKVRLSPNKMRRKSRYLLAAGGGEGGGEDGYESHLVSPPLALPRLPPKGYMRLLGSRDDFLFLKWHSDKRPVWRPARIPSQRCANAAEHRPAVAKNRDIARQGRRKDGTTVTPAHRGRAASGQASCSLIQLAAVSTCCQFWFTERGTCAGSQCRWVPVCAAFRSACGKLELSTTPSARGPEVPAALAEPDASHSRKAAAAAEKHDLTLMQPLLPHSCWVLRDFAVLDLHCATNVFPELCKLGISQPSGLLAAFRSAHEELGFSTIPGKRFYRPPFHTSFRKCDSPRSPRRSRFRSPMKLYQLMQECWDGGHLGAQTVEDTFAQCFRSTEHRVLRHFVPGYADRRSFSRWPLPQTG